MMPNEHTPFVRSLKERKKFRYNFQMIKSKGAILMLILDLLMQVFQAYVWFLLIIFSSKEEFNNISTFLFSFIINIRYIALMFYPLGGLIADTCVGRYKMIVCSIIYSFVTWIIFVMICLFMWMQQHSEMSTLSHIPLGFLFIIIIYWTCRISIKCHTIQY